MAFHRDLSDSKSPQVSRILPNVQPDLTNAVVWEVSARPLISKSPSLCTNPLVTVPSAPVTIGITVTCMFLIIIVIIVIFLAFFPFNVIWCFFHWCLNDSKFFQVSGTLFSILADVNNALVLIVSIYTWFFNFSSFFLNFWERSKNANCESCHSHVPQLFFLFSGKV